MIVAPFILSFTGYRNSEWNSIAAIRIWGGRGASWLSWINVLLGLWMIASPWIYGNSSVHAILWDDVIVGALIVILGIWSALATEPRV